MASTSGGVESSGGPRAFPGGLATELARSAIADGGGPSSGGWSLV